VPSGAAEAEPALLVPSAILVTVCRMRHPRHRSSHAATDFSWRVVGRCEEPSRFRSWWDVADVVVVILSIGGGCIGWIVHRKGAAARAEQNRLLHEWLVGANPESAVRQLYALMEPKQLGGTRHTPRSRMPKAPPEATAPLMPGRQPGAPRNGLSAVPSSSIIIGPGSVAGGAEFEELARLAAVGRRQHRTRLVAGGALAAVFLVAAIAAVVLIVTGGGEDGGAVPAPA
jgi:hypothetical protein